MRRYSRLLRKLQHITDEPGAEARILWTDLGGSWPPGTGSQPIDSVLDFALNLRKSRFPLAYITGWSYFYGRPFLVLPGVFIPRMDTEILYLTFKEYFADMDSPVIVSDVGTGTGCIGITIALEYPNSRVIAIDVSKIAIKNAVFNSKFWGVRDRFFTVLSDRLNPVMEGVLDSVVINPPYVPTGLIHGLPVEVQHEPVIALDGGPDGLQFIQPLLIQAQKSLKENGLVFLELSRDQQSGLIELATNLNFSILDVREGLDNGIVAIVLKKEGERTK